MACPTALNMMDLSIYIIEKWMYEARYLELKAVLPAPEDKDNLKELIVSLFEPATPANGPIKYRWALLDHLKGIFSAKLTLREVLKIMRMANQWIPADARRPLGVARALKFWLSDQGLGHDQDYQQWLQEGIAHMETGWPGFMSGHPAIGRVVVDHSKAKFIVVSSSLEDE